MNRETIAKKEETYQAENNIPISMCRGTFYIKSKKRTEVCKKCNMCLKYKRFKDKIYHDGEVRFHYVDSFRNCKLYEDIYSDSEVIKLAIYSTLYVNDLAITSIYELDELIDSQDNETKKIYKALLKRRKAYEKGLFEFVNKDMDFLGAYESYMDDYAEPVMLDMKEAILRFLKVRNVDNDDFIARVEVVRTLLGYSVLNIEKMIKICSKYGNNIVNLRYYKLDDLLRVAENLSNWVCRKVKETSDLNNDEDIMFHYRKLDRILNDRHLIQYNLKQGEDWVDTHD